MTYVFMDKDGVVQCIRDDPVYSAYRFEDMVYEGEFPYDAARPIMSGMRLLFVDDVDGETIVCHVNGAEKNDVDGTVLVTAEHIFLHDSLSHLRPTDAGDDGFTYDWSGLDKELTAFVTHYMPTGWALGDVSPLIAPSTPGNVATYKVVTSGARLNMRRTASLTGTIIKAYNNSTIVKLVSSSNPTWYKVEAPDGKIGYMYAANLTLVSSTGAASSTYTVNVEIVGGISHKKLYDEIAKRYAVRFVPRVTVSGTTITKYVDILLGEPMFSGGRISLAQTISNLSHIVDDSEVITTIYPVTDDGSYVLSDVDEAVLSQTKSADTFVRVGRLLKNTTRIAELGEERVRVVSFDPTGIDSRTKLQNAALDYLIYYRDPQVTVDGLAADLYAQGYGGEPIRFGDLITVELVDDPNVMASVSALTRNYLKPEQTLVTVGTYRKDFATAGNTPISVSGSISVTGGFGGGAVGGIADLTINDAGQLVVRYTSGATKNLGSLTGKSIVALTAYIEAVFAGAVTTDVLYAALAKIQKLIVESIDAETIETDELFAAYARILTLAVGQINAGNITTNQLAAVLGNFVTLHAATGNFDFATIRNLIADAMIIREGIGGSVYIDNLTATSALIISATLGELVIKGDDGKYYQITVRSDGTIGTVEVVPTSTEIGDGEMADGRGIVETAINVVALTAQTIKATSAIIGTILTTALTAEKITVGQAMISSATIPELYSTVIAAIGTNLTLRGDSVTIEIDGAEEGEVAARFDKDGGYSPNFVSPTVAKRRPGGVYKVYAGADFDTLADAFADIGGAVLDGDVVYKVGRSDAGGVIRGVRGGCRVIITSGNLIERYAASANNATLAADGSYGYKAIATTAGTYRHVRILVGRVGDMGLAGKEITIGVGTITSAGGTAVLAVLRLYDATGTTLLADVTSVYASDTSRTATIPADADDDDLVMVAVYVSRETSCAAGAYVIYDRLLVELGSEVFSWPTAKYDIASVEIEGCDEVDLARINLPNGARIRNANAVISRTEIYNTIRANMAHVRMNDNKGSCTEAVKALCARVLVTGTAPSGTYTGKDVDTTGATIAGSGTAPTEIVKTLTANSTGTYTTYWWSSDHLVRQGYTTSNGRHKGGIWWDFTAIPAGATVSGMKLTLKRDSGYGQDAPVTVKIYGTSSSARSGAPALTMGPYTLGTMGWGVTKTFDLPAALVTALAAGTVKGIVLYADDTSAMSGQPYSANYGRFGGTDGTVPKLAVTYTV